ncbi:hypothetical protein KUTeg_000217 [Tegillarca granosa]|uniref:Uncharacterized protein n=1 Tax=Tegillarca granosa TaxID=220873 RepID=A0ABQ9G004_TEGGR|nr:hypothetical protein KUTeg_000217 [Tegillarca granosa]
MLGMLILIMYTNISNTDEEGFSPLDLQFIVTPLMIDASDEDGSCGHLIQNSLNYPWSCKKVKLTPVVQKQKKHCDVETSDFRRKKKLKTNYLNENYMNKTEVLNIGNLQRKANHRKNV